MDEQLTQYLQAILEVNKTINLTNIREENEARLLHIEDSLAVLPEIEVAPQGLYGDMGSGGGFPGVPIGIVSGRDTILIDSVKKKMSAVQDVLHKLHLDDQIRTCDMRIEELAKEMPGEFSVITARALSSLPSLIELASPLLKQGGRLVCLKAHAADEVAAAQKIERETGMTFLSSRSYYLSDGKTYREVIVFEKTAVPSIKLPRRVGLAQKKPLV